MKKALLVLLVLALVGAGAGAYYLRRGGTEFQVTTAPLTRGDIIDAVGAAGTLQAVTTVQVGTQVSGTILALNADFNSIVRKGQVIARLDPSLFDTQIEQARANVARAQADVERLRVALDDARSKLARAEELSRRQLLAQTDLEAAQLTVKASDAQLRSAQAQVDQARASLHQNEVNLEHTVIAAPIDGIVISRNVDVGQTVAASLQSPTLFVIAADLTKMQVTANIDEADVGRIRPGQVVTFRVDAYPTDDFTGTVSQIRLQPLVVQNVTTYGTVIDVPNADLRLKPGMTATVRIQLARRAGVVRVPNSALRFRPTPDMFAALGQASPEVPRGAGAGPRAGPGGGASTSGGDAESGAAATPAAPAAERPPAAQEGSPRSPGHDPERRQRFTERAGNLSPEDRAAFLARRRDRAGADVAPTPPSARSVDALFAPLPTTESVGRAWLYVNGQLKPVRLRLGISDGTWTELLGDPMEPGTELVTSISVSGTGRPAAIGGQSPLVPNRGGQGFRGPGAR